MNGIKTIQILEDEHDSFYIRFPESHAEMLKAMKSLIPYEDRRQEKDMGWVPDVKAWRFPMKFQNQVLLLAEQLTPWSIEEVDVLE